MSDSVWPHGLQPTRLLHPWDSPGKNTGVGCHFFSSTWKWKVKVKSLSCVRLSDPKDYSLPGSSIHGIFQARVLEWGAIRWQQKGWDVGQFYPRQQGLYSDNKLTQSLKLMTQAHNTNYPHPQHFAPISQKYLVLFQTSTVKQPRRDKLPDQSCKRKKKRIRASTAVTIKQNLP